MKKQPGRYRYLLGSTGGIDLSDLMDGGSCGACKAAGEFLTWCEGLCEPLRDDPDMVKINQTKLRILNKYLEWRTVVGVGCRDRISERDHACIYQVFIDVCEALRELEISLSPPPLAFQPEVSVEELRVLAEREASRAVERAAQEASRTLFLPKSEG